MHACMYVWEPDLEFECSLGIHAPFYQELTDLYKQQHVEYTGNKKTILFSYLSLNRLHPGTLAEVLGRDNE